jgi:hypothetical protein
VAQLGARLNGIQQVEGSNPFASTQFLRMKLQIVDLQVENSLPAIFNPKSAICNPARLTPS